MTAKNNAAAPASPPAETGEGESEVERLKGKLRNVVSHATGGNCLEGDDLSLNEISVRITQFRNKLYEAGKQSAQPVSPSEGDRESLAAEALQWRENVTLLLNEPDPDVVRVREGGGAEDLIMSLVVTMAKTRKNRNATHPASDQSDTERMRKARTEVELVGSIARAAQQDFDSLEAAWPPSKRGSRAQKALDSLRDRISGMDECAKDASAALAEKAADK